MFDIGQQVVCVDDTFDPSRDDGRVYPQRGVVYTIRGFYDGPVTPDDSSPAVFLEEVVNPPHDYLAYGVYEPSFYVWRFRPIKKTDISVFEAMLAPAPKVPELV